MTVNFFSSNFFTNSFSRPRTENKPIGLELQHNSIKKTIFMWETFDKYYESFCFLGRGEKKLKENERKRREICFDHEDQWLEDTWWFPQVRKPSR